MEDILKRVWEDRSEVDIHKCIIEAYTHQNFSVYNVHENRSRSEKGIDITCEKGGEKIIFQVKKRPDGNDIKQLTIFSEQEADRRIYISISPPTSNFKKEMDKNKGDVEFWDKLQLHEMLLENDSSIYIVYLFGETNLINNLTETLIIFLECKDSDFKPIKKLTKEHYNMLWRLKDESVKLHTCLNLCLRRWKPLLINEKSLDLSTKTKILKNIIRELDEINEITGNKILISFKICKQRYSWIMAYGFYVSFTKMRSNWLDFYEPSKQNSDISILNKNMKNWFIKNETDYGFYSVIIEILSNLYKKAEAIEDMFDWIFNDKNMTLPIMNEEDFNLSLFEKLS